MTLNPPPFPTPDLLTLVKPQIADFLLICHQLPEDQRRQFEILGDFDKYDPEKVALSLVNRSGPKWCAVKQSGEPVGIGGLEMIIPGVWQDFLITTDECWISYAKSITRFCKDITARVIASGEAQRIQAVTLASNRRIRRWYKLLDMKYEGRLRAFGRGGVDAVMYAVTRGAQ